jgi:hypothetical protein
VDKSETAKNEADEHVQRIAAAVEMIRQARAERNEAVQAARACGVTWSRIAEALGTSRQAAHERFAWKERPSDEVPF